MLALRPQARFGGQPGRKARLLGRRSSRGPRRAANVRPNGTAITLRAAVGRGALTPPDPAPLPQTPAGGYGIRPYIGFAALETRGFLFSKKQTAAHPSHGRRSV